MLHSIIVIGLLALSAGNVQAAPDISRNAAANGRGNRIPFQRDPAFVKAKAEQVKKFKRCKDSLETCAKEWAAENPAGRRPIRSAMRRRIFADNVATIAAINADPESTWIAGLNDDSDLTLEEMKVKRLGIIKLPTTAEIEQSQNVTAVPNASSLNKRQMAPDAIDWRANPTNFMTPVKDKSRTKGKK